jgi:hypothetical protein
MIHGPIRGVESIYGARGELRNLAPPSPHLTLPICPTPGRGMGGGDKLRRPTAGGELVTPIGFCMLLEAVGLPACLVLTNNGMRTMCFTVLSKKW